MLISATVLELLRKSRRGRFRPPPPSGARVKFHDTVPFPDTRRRQRRYPAKAADKSLPAAGGVLSGWAAPSHEAVPAHLFGQHVHQLRADAADGCRREWETLQMTAPLADGPRTNGTTKSAVGVGSDAQAEKCERLSSERESAVQNRLRSRYRWLFLNFSESTRCAGAEKRLFASAYVTTELCIACRLIT